MRLNIGIYANPLFGKRTGIGNYIYNLCKAVEKVVKDDVHFFLFSQKTLKDEDVPFSRNYIIIEEKNFLIKKIPSSLWFVFFSWRLINEYPIDVFWSGLPFVPWNLNPRVKRVATVHDLNYRLVPKTLRLRTRLAYNLLFEKSVLKANKVLAVSEGTAKKLRNFLGLEVDAVIHPGVNTRVFRPLGKKEVIRYLNFRRLPEKFFLSVSTLEPRKNLKSLIDAFLELKAEGKLRRYKLVLAGDRGWKSSNVKRKLRRFSSEIIYLGYVPERELPFLYNGASLFILPSIYEGFGMPAQEARACGCCVMVSDIPELHESAGPGAIYVKPTKEGLKEALSLFEKGKLSCDKKRLREGLFLWEEEAKKLAEVLIK